MFDVIGDIHGQADALRRLLTQLGYQHKKGAYRHEKRTAVFVGDFIDRGPRIKEVMEIVRPMVEQETALAVMGNHEFNAIAFHARHPNGGHLRPHIRKNIKQTYETILQFTDDELADHIEWFRQLPMWIEEEGLRVVHACWSDAHIATIKSARGGNTQPISDDFVRDACERGDLLYQAIETVLKGPESTLPGGLSFRDKDGHQRTEARTRWYLDARTPRLTWRDFAFCFRTSEREAMPNTELPAPQNQAPGYPEDAPPVIFGHYWVPPEDELLKPLAPNVACVDFSAGKGGLLAAYRWDGEATLSADKFVAVSAG
jgi:hypothetical protein